MATTPEEQIALGIHALALIEASILLSISSTKLPDEWLKLLLKAGREKAEAASPIELQQILIRMLQAGEVL